MKPYYQDEITGRWYAPGEIRFTLNHILFLLENINLLEDGFYPPNPEETGYQELKIAVARGKPRAYFETPICLIAEIKLRISLAKDNHNDDGKLLLDKYRLGLNDDELARVNHLSYNQVITGINSALLFITGWKRERLPYSDWCRKYRYKTNARLSG